MRKDCQALRRKWNNEVIEKTCNVFSKVMYDLLLIGEVFVI